MLFDANDFPRRHIGPSPHEISLMLETIGVATLDKLIDQTIPPAIRQRTALNLGPARSESDVLARLRETAEKNRILRSMIGQGYYGTVTPPVILRNILENPAWYTAYTPYQSEISQGRLEALLNFQTMARSMQLLQAKGAPVGLQPGAAFARETVIVPDGSRLYLFSDGAFEVQRPDGSMMQLEDLLQFISRPATGGQCDLDLLLQHLVQVRGGEALEDDFRSSDSRSDNPGTRPRASGCDLADSKQKSRS